MCSIDSDSSPSVWNSRYVKARQLHRCCCCGSRISIGDRYRDLFAIFDGEPHQEKACEACGAIAQLFAEEHGFSDYTAHSLMDLLRECWDGADKTETKLWRTASAVIYRKNRRAKKERYA